MSNICKISINQTLVVLWFIRLDSAVQQINYYNFIGQVLPKAIEPLQVLAPTLPCPAPKNWGLQFAQADNKSAIVG